MEILGVSELVRDEPVTAKLGKTPYISRMQAGGLVRVAVRRACWQTAQTLAGYLESRGESGLADELRAMTAEELADGVDVSAPVGSGDKGHGTGDKEEAA